MHGQDSVWSALQDMWLILLPDEESHVFRWTSLNEAKIPEKVYETLLDLQTQRESVGIKSQCLGLCNDPVRMDREYQDQLNLPTRSSGQYMRNGDAMLAIRSQNWPETCPKFCLFVQSNSFEYSQEILRQLLEETIKAKNICGESNRPLSYSDWQLLHKWRKALKCN